ncbi:hypothetical protein [uncultured Tenacibaculum sp.]|uniref:hypothetical protein n=1 Tax=uncultured Tenacibaculum sp. TaxID=174713 RepID=UPI00260C2FFC|nr:hypothetical protein [uncultured Tenacibaculum sp.]
MLLKKMLKESGIKELSKENLVSINGGANDYYCWDAKGNTFNSSTDVSSSSVHCTPIAVVEEDVHLYPFDGIRP